jgi:hypothetical protein
MDLFCVHIADSLRKTPSSLQCGGNIEDIFLISYRYMLTKQPLPKHFAPLIYQSFNTALSHSKSNFQCPKRYTSWNIPVHCGAFTDYSESTCSWNHDVCSSSNKKTIIIQVSYCLIVTFYIPSKRFGFNSTKQLKSICYCVHNVITLSQKENSVALVRVRTMPTKRLQLVDEVVPTFADRGCCVVSATDPRSLVSVFLTGAATISSK